LGRLERAVVLAEEGAFLAAIAAAFEASSAALVPAPPPDLGVTAAFDGRGDGILVPEVARAEENGSCGGGTGRGQSLSEGRCLGVGTAGEAAAGRESNDSRGDER
jgi:hypothetical protein